MKKIICLAILALMILPLVVACADNTTDAPTDTTTAEATVSTTVPGDDTADTTSPKIEADIPDVKYNGYEFVVANDFVRSTKYTSNAIRSDDQIGEPINDALYDRTVKMEEQFGIKIVDMDIALSNVMVTLRSDEDLYTVTTADLSNVMKLVNAGYCRDFNDVDSIDLDKPWWDQNAAQKLSIAGKLYYTFSDFFITALDNARATYFNKDLVRDLGLESPYKLVDANKWTMEKMREMGIVAVSDLDGISGITTADRVGIANVATTFYEAMLTGCDAEIMKQGANGIPYFCCFDEKEYFLQVYEYLLNTFSTDGFYLITKTDEGRNMFTSNQALFTVDTLYMASISRQSDVNFGILPIAKYTETQENYLHVSPNPHCMMIPHTTKNIERTGVLLEAISYYSSSYYSDKALIPSYYETALKSKSATDDESAEMLTIIHDNISYVNKIVGTDLSSSIFTQFANANYNITSILKGSENPQKKLLSNTISKLSD